MGIIYFSTTFKNNLTKIDLHPFEAICLKYLKNLPYTPTRKQKRELFEKFDRELQALPSDIPVLGLGEISNWVKSKLESGPSRSYGE